MKEARDLGISAHLIDPFSVRVVRQKGKNSIQEGALKLFLQSADDKDEELSPPATVIPRIGSTSDEYALSVTLAMEVAGFSVVNPYKSLIRVRNKVNALLELYEAGYSVLPFAMVREPREITDIVRMLGGQPLVTKFIRGSQGVGVLKTTESGTTRALVQAFNRLGYDVYVEKFLPGAKKRDLRFIVVNGEFLASMEKKPRKGEYRGNVHLGAKPVPYNPTQEEIKVAEGISKLFGLGLCGVDILRAGNAFYILEVNSSPGLIGISEATGRNIAREVIMKLAQRPKGKS